MVLFSAGRVGRHRVAQSPAAGLAADDRGRLEGRRTFRTAVPHIFAAGDVIGFPAWRRRRPSRAAWPRATRSASRPGRWRRTFPIGIYSIPEISMVGATEEELTEEKVPYETGVARYREIARGPDPR